jgi:hypothetical protein
VDSRSWPCPTCRDVTEFEQPPCVDGHDDVECPEWACADCGSAFVVGHASVVADVLRLRHAA